MKPNTMVDRDFGKLKWDKKLLVWRGRSTMAEGTPFQLLIHTRAYLTQKPPFEDATWDRTITPETHEAFLRICSSDSRLRAAIVKEFLPRYSKWNDGNSIKAPAFLRRLRLESVTLLPDGTAQVFYGDDGMFGGHALIVHLDRSGAVRQVAL